jgi:hypothetical protein
MVIEKLENIEYTETLKEYVPYELKQYIKIYDCRNVRGCSNDILFVINKNL